MQDTITMRPWLGWREYSRGKASGRAESINLCVASRASGGGSGTVSALDLWR
ncbi:MAG TPA: hypothetical protein VNA16_02330 [Abditibacteriaceae bacterium]|nr:hypothetical protein [Abditibacteriaceae bacterium]